MELLHMKISDLLLDPHLDFLGFPKHKNWVEGKIPRPGYFHPHPILLTCHAICYLDQ